MMVKDVCETDTDADAITGTMSLTIAVTQTSILSVAAISREMSLTQTLLDADINKDQENFIFDEKNEVNSSTTLNTSQSRTTNGGTLIGLGLVTRQSMALEVLNDIKNYLKLFNVHIPAGSIGIASNRNYQEYGRYTRMVEYLESIAYVYENSANSGGSNASKYKGNGRMSGSVSNSYGAYGSSYGSSSREDAAGYCCILM